MRRSPVRVREVALQKEGLGLLFHFQRLDTGGSYLALARTIIVKGHNFQVREVALRRVWEVALK